MFWGSAASAENTYSTYLSSACIHLDSFPARFGGVHFVNQPWYIHALYTLIKPFLKDKTRKRIFLHGNNLNSLHQLIHPECLPSEFGGTLPPYDMGTWARTLLGPDYSDENEYTHTSYNAMHVKHASSNLEREASPKPMKRLVQPLKSSLIWLSSVVWHKSSRKGLSGSERGCSLANVDGRESFTLDCVHGVAGEKKPLYETLITRLITGDIALKLIAHSSLGGNSWPKPEKMEDNKSL
ncbi:clavesin-1 [Limosa lapponica baueri]|uniref:Clavesin-1 n=1 Tax=Limosa lapponica baueri TaxID=1758121 RepID=A0A2I0TKJ0_LIMLA|nr:clavesin-1 [Limosa lapponica baueri]